MPLLSKKVLVLFFLALAFRLGFFGAFAYLRGDLNVQVGGGDAAMYWQLGKNVFSGNGFSESIKSPFTPVAGRMPVVPVIMGLFGNWLVGYILLHMIISAAAVIVLYRIGQVLFGEIIASWTAVIFAIDPLSAFHSLQFLSETYFTFFFLLAIYCLGRFWKDGRLGITAASAVFLALATLTRPVGVVFVPLVVFAIIALIKVPWSRKFAASFLFILVFLAGVSPWLIRNHRVFGVWGLSSLPAYNLYWYNARQIYAHTTGVSSEAAKRQFRTWAEEAARKPDYDNELKLQRFHLSRSFEVIRPHVAEYVKLQFLNSAAVYLNTGYNDIAKALGRSRAEINFTPYVQRGLAGLTALMREHPWIFGFKLALVAIYGIIVLGIWLNLGLGQWHGRYLFLILTLLVFGLTTGAVAEPRFRVPAQPFVILAFVEVVYVLMSRNANIEDQLKL